MEWLQRVCTSLGRHIRHTQHIIWKLLNVADGAEMLESSSLKIVSPANYVSFFSRNLVEFPVFLCMLFGRVTWSTAGRALFFPSRPRPWTTSRFVPGKGGKGVDLSFALGDLGCFVPPCPVLDQKMLWKKFCLPWSHGTGPVYFAYMKTIIKKINTMNVWQIYTKIVSGKVP